MVRPGFTEEGQASNQASRARSVGRSSRSAITAKKRIIFIHGLGPQPPKQQYLRQWRDALRLSLWANIPHQASCMAYWADLRGQVNFRDPKVRAEVARLRKRLWRLEERFAYHPDKALRLLRARTVQFLFDLYCRLLRRGDPLLSQIERQWLNDYYRYVHSNAVQAKIRRRLEAELDAAAQEGQRVAIVAHSMGTVIAYDALAKNPEYVVDLLVTMGSPLGFTAVQIDLTKQAHPPFPPNVSQWLNVFDGIDVVTLPDQRLANDFTNGKPRIADRMIRSNTDRDGKRDPHHWHGYLSCDEVGDAVSKFWIAPAPQPTTTP